MWTISKFDSPSWYHLRWCFLWSPFPLENTRLRSCWSIQPPKRQLKPPIHLPHVWPLSPSPTTSSTGTCGAPIADQSFPKSPPLYAHIPVVTVSLKFFWWSNLLFSFLRSFYKLLFFKLSQKTFFSTHTNLWNKFSIFSNHIVSIKKMDKSNHSTWPSKTSYKSHLITTVESVPTKHQEQWIKLDDQLCIIINSTIHTSLKSIFYLRETCASVWSEAHAFYTNITQPLYSAKTS